ncbi:Uma2 family endonuclease [Chromatium okenii]|uniref:Putative restriction endonuclease domain-containing protein n=1 Tax=Chromatium okenii TaxID=61644 RepID=A0A2S7XNC1_9GAMM|nr:Uma2 family endonuclease [Chromatium okenii]PQJ95230.1 hypothetical protein CXB77_13255 [Chromatium okenii]
MTISSILQIPLTVDAYLTGEENCELRHEYIGGQIYAMTGASRQHGLIVTNLIAFLRPQLRSSHCQIFANDMKVRLFIGGDDIFYYPDLLLSCDPNDRERYYCTHPCLIIEVLSNSTERIDRREKLLAYQTLPSLREYLLIAQNRREVQIHRRSQQWKAEIITAGEVALNCIDCALPIEMIYEEIDGLT